jgi:hypothetical protein
VVLVPSDLTLRDWPERAQRAGLTTIALHPFPTEVLSFIRSEDGQRFLEKCQALGIQVEYELHAMQELLPRELFARHPDLFRMNEAGERTPDANLCVSSEGALEIVAQNALTVSRALRPTTGRYFLWGDDGRPYCRCPNCADLCDGDQALILENRVLEALRTEDPGAQVAHLAYARTLLPPRRIRPERGIFLEYAPIDRRYDLPLSSNDDATQRHHLEQLDANLKVFGREGAQALEYWLDASRFSRWKRPAMKVPFDLGVLAQDVETYGSRGIRHITTFAVWIDGEYIARYGDPPLSAYGQMLQKWQGNSLGSWSGKFPHQLKRV